MKNDFKTFDSMCKGIVKQAKQNLGLPIRLNGEIKVVINDICYSLYYDDGLEQLCGIPSVSSADRLWVEASDLINNTELLPYYDLAVENKERALSSIRNLVKHKFGGQYSFRTPFEVTYRSYNHWNGKATIQEVHYRDGEIRAYALYLGKEFPILPEDYFTIQERIYSQEQNED